MFICVCASAYLTKVLPTSVYIEQRDGFGNFYNWPSSLCVEMRDDVQLCTKAINKLEAEQLRLRLLQLSSP